MNSNYNLGGTGLNFHENVKMQTVILVVNGAWLSMSEQKVYMMMYQTQQLIARSKLLITQAYLLVSFVCKYDVTEALLWRTTGTAFTTTVPNHTTIPLLAIPIVFQSITLYDVTDSTL